MQILEGCAGVSAHAVSISALGYIGGGPLIGMAC